MADSQSWSAFGSPNAGPAGTGGPGADRHAADPPEPEYGPAPPAGPGRASFGFTAGPISGNHNSGRPTSGAPSGRPAPTSGAPSGNRKGRPAPTSGAPSGNHKGRPGPTSGAPFQPPPTGPAPHPLRSVTGESVLARSRQSRPLPPPPADEDDGVGDFIGGPGREIRPHRAARHPHSSAEQPVLLESPPRGRGVLIAGFALGLAVLLGGTVAGVSYFSGSDKSLTSVLELGAGTSDAGDRTATAPIDSRTAASFELATAVTKVTMRSEDLGDDLYRISTAEDAGIIPKPVLAQDRVQLNLIPDGDGTTGAVEVVLSSKVMWSLRFAGATDEQRIDFTGGEIGGIDLVGGSRVTEIALPAPAGTVALKVTGAVDELSLTSPAGNPVRVQMQGGAKTVAAGARTLRDVKPGSTLTPKGWATNNRYDVTAEARVTLLRVETK
ncbi:hypothetical protein [Actinoplanes sp. ATCC 53533]|uniref:hypothetical protein n=1 Tax=Actinoplanes sp. ATCC 53533 TaxID=1288362 RepID=UPI000F77DE35|nr:hypothetical protein [Actinoplanes sp. ATCC 53533]